jgi:hypothetical protein
LVGGGAERETHGANEVTCATTSRKKKVAETRRRVTISAWRAYTGAPGIVEKNELPAVRLFMAHGSLFADTGGKRQHVSRLAPGYALRSAEDVFARDVLTFATQYWLFRTHQQGRIGDFIALDRSSSATEPVRCFAIELKRSAPLRLWRRGIQLAECDQAVRWVALQADGAALTAIPVVGSADRVLELMRRGADAFRPYTSNGSVPL